jgi:hypothetical protein
MAAIASATLILLLASKPREAKAVGEAIAPQHDMDA